MVAVKNPMPSGMLKKVGIPACWAFDRPLLLLTLTAAFWGGNLVAGKMAAGRIDPYALTVLRWAGALLLMLPLAMPSLRREARVIRANLPLLLAYGAIGYCAFNIMTYVALQTTSGVNASIEQVSVNIFTMLFSFILFKTRVGWLQLAGVALTIVGVALTATHGSLGTLMELQIGYGDALILTAGLIYALYSISLRYRPALNWLSFLTMTTTGALAAAIVAQITIAKTPLLDQIIVLGWREWLIILYVLVFPSLLAQMFYVRGVELIGANRASLFMNLVPVFGVLGSVVVLNETFEPYHFLAAGFVICGMALAEWSARRAKAYA